ncbi:hypothetical protein ACH5RR_035077 [Cinchona calisaya]|uniref:TF-B3 domain-containing protein n=1 Tax=Cinchona calisaya TaxID=153742 RepID=A0ABD2YCT3_9GENT
MFDGETSCEKERSCLISSRCEHGEVDTRNKRKQKSPETLCATNGGSHVFVEFEDRTWDASIYLTGNDGALISGGWRNFVVDNSLEEFDVCVFDLVNETTNALVMDVKIFRVVDVVDPPSRVTPVSSRGKKS